MKIRLAPLVVSIFVFAISCVLLNRLEIKPTGIVIEINAVIPEDDSFQLFYSLESADEAKELCVTANVKGSKNFQRILFNIPTERSVKRFRIALGSNQRQDTIKIKDIELKSPRTNLHYNIIDAFDINEYIDLGNGEVHLQTVGDQYQPCLTPKFDVETVIGNLSKMQRALPWGIVIVLSLILSVSLFLVTYYTGFQLVSLRRSPYIVVFVLILSAPLIVKTLNIDIDSKFTEKRELASKPDFEFSRDYPRKYEEYYNDNFGLRSLLVNWNSELKMDFFKVSPQSKLVLFGKNGFLFYNSKNDGIYGSYSNSNVVDEQALEKAYQKQLDIKQSLEKRGIKYVVGFFPNKHTIYRDYLPFSMRMQVIGDTSLADQLTNYFKSHDFPFIDIRDDLRAARKEKQLYYKFDTHWNLYGAYIGYKSFFDQTFDILGVTPHDTSFFDIIYTQSRAGDLTNMMGISEMKSYYDEIPNIHLRDPKNGYGFMEPHGFPTNTIITINNSGRNQTVLVYRDSYTEALIPLISLHFHKVIYVWGYEVDMDLVDRAKPDIVISTCVERYLPHFFR